jgi:ornithine cyclodeaminase/alanine dehydrogenase
VLILSEKDLRLVLRMRDVIESVEEGFRALSRGEARAPDRLGLNLPEADAVLFQMPASIRRQALGAKVVSVFGNNSARGLETVQAVYLLLDAETGEPLSLMEGRFITAIRTAATSAVATKFCATQGKKRLGILGAGLQGRFHIEAMTEVAEIAEALVCSRSEDKARQLAEAARRDFDIRCEIATPDEIASGCDLICACTTSAEPLFDGRLLRAGTHINAVGAFTPDARELDTETVSRSRVIIDAQSAAGREAGDLLIPLSESAITRDHIKGDLADVVSNRVKGRESEDEITLFKSCGLAIEDLVTARLAYQKAVERGTGLPASL